VKTTTLSNLFSAVGKLEHAITQAAGLDVMTEDDAQALLTMVNLCTRAAHVPLELRNALAKPASPATVKLGDGEAAFMDETMGYKQPPKVRNIAGTLSGNMKDIAALTPEEVRALPVEGLAEAIQAEARQQGSAS